MKPVSHQAERVALASALLLFAAACSKDAPPAGQAEQAQAAATQPAAQPAAAPAADLDPCTLLMPAEAQEITGKSFGIPVRNETSPNVCMFEADGGPNFNYAIMPVGAGNDADAMAARFRDRDVTVTAAPGIGDRSFWSPQSGVTQLNTFKGGWHIMLTAAFVADTPAQEQEIVGKLMLQILTRL
ncbi:MAG: DUF3558 domain-containing protein [Gemmatimonadetes bacterium]|nr:DUF3558 domain-containing protein [Gemmatimonadota bacterium]